MKRYLPFIIIAEVLVLIALIAFCVHLGADTPTESSDTSGTNAPPASSTQESTPPPTGNDGESTTSSTVTPPEPNKDPVESLYTREELEAMDTAYNKDGYGPGTTSDGKQPPYAVADQQKYGQYGAKFVTAQTDCIYLTFDCGYEYSYTDASGKTVRVTEQILDTLKQKNVKAVFFVTMPYCKSNPDLVRRMIDEGHAVGNHSNHHPSSMAALTIDEMIDEVMSLHDYVKENFGYEMHFFRPPTGAFSVQSLAVVQNLGYESIFWSFAHKDWSPDDQPTEEQALATIKGRCHGGAIYLLHAVSTTNAAVLDEAIDWFRAEGFRLELLPYGQ